MLAFPPSERIQMLLDPLEKFRKGGIQHQKGKRIPAQIFNSREQQDRGYLVFLVLRSAGPYIFKTHDFIINS